jgi:hypothetical protein
VLCDAKLLQVPAFDLSQKKKKKKPSSSAHKDKAEEVAEEVEKLSGTTNKLAHLDSTILIRA